MGLCNAKRLSLTNVLWLVALAILALTGCARTVWVNSGATAADFQAMKGQCLASAYSQVPSAPAVATIGSGYVSPAVTTCSGFGYSASCVTSGGQYTPPASIQYDANAGARTEVFKGCMYAVGWSEEVQSNGATVVSAESDWTKGLNYGVKEGSNGQCATPPAGITNAADWSLGCRSGQRGHWYKGPPVTSRVSGPYVHAIGPTSGGNVSRRGGASCNSATSI
jgi:hypothetical protein